MKILSGGAALGLVEALRPAFERETGDHIEGDFGAVGGMKDRIVGGEAVDLIILTRAIVDDLVVRGLAEGDTVADVGKVETGVAARSGENHPDIANGEALRDALLAADSIYFPDPNLATAGIHFASVLDRLRVREDLKERLRPHPNGATAMRAMAASTDAQPIGCTQVTEIISTPGVDLVGVLPAGYDLATFYTVAVSATAANPGSARGFAQLLTAASNEQARRQAGFSV